MWHEARKMEKKLWTIMVDHKKRAERRRDYYEKIKLDPNQFLQIHGRRCKIHLDPSVAAAAEAPATMMPWQGQKDNLIDRFDGRAHLDIIPEVVPDLDKKLSPEEAKEQRNANYERYRILVQNDFLKISEEKFLRTIQLEEQFGGKTYQHVKSKEEKKKSEKNKAAIGFVYEDSTEHARFPDFKDFGGNGSSGDSDSDSEMDLDLAVDIMALTEDSRQEINSVGKTYSLGKQDFIKYLARDIEEAQELRLAKENEEGKNVTSGRKGRRERRLLREQKLKGRKISPPSYATRESPSYSDYNRSHSSSRSPSPVNAGKIEFITSFGAESDDDDKRVADLVGPAVGSSINLKKLRNNEREEDVIGRRTSAVYGPSLLGERSSDSKKSRYRSRSRSNRRNRSGSRDNNRKRSRSRSRGRRNRDRSKSRSLSRRHREDSRNRSRKSRSRSTDIDNRKSKKVSDRKDRSRTRSRSSPETKKKRRSSSDESLKRKRKKTPSSSSSSSSSSEEDAANNSNKYRSKYRNRRRSSSSSSSESGKSESSKEKSDNERRMSPRPVRRYYGRAGIEKSDSELSGLETEEMQRETSKTVISKTVSKQPNNVGTPQVDHVAEKIRRKMQAQIRKQFKADKRAEEEKRQREEENRITREEELREIAIKIRRRERRDSRSPSSSPSPVRRTPDRNGSSHRSRSNRSRSSRSPLARSSRADKHSRRSSS